LEPSVVVFHNESHFVFGKTIIRVINILFVTCVFYISLILSVCVATGSWAHIR
jgi:hypothetical protein